MAGPRVLPGRTEKRITAAAVFTFRSSEDLRRKRENQIYLLKLNFSISGTRSFGVISSHSGVPAPQGPAWSKSGGNWDVCVCEREREKEKRGRKAEREGGGENENKTILRDF